MSSTQNIPNPEITNNHAKNRRINLWMMKHMNEYTKGLATLPEDDPARVDPKAHGDTTQGPNNLANVLQEQKSYNRGFMS